jgi:O-antigen/teichoic acid export membrane protein
LRTLSSLLKRIQDSLPVDLRPLLGSSALYGVSIVLSRSAGIVVTPLLARVFGTADYGVLDTVVAFTVVLPIFMSLSLEQALVRYYYQTPAGHQRRIFVSTILTSALALSALVAMVLCAAANAIGSVLFRSSSYDAIITTAILGSASQLMAYLLLWVLRLQQKLRDFLTCSIVAVSSNLALICILVLGLRVGIIGYFIALMASSLLQCAVAVWLLRGEFESCWSYAVFRRSVVFSLPFIPTVFLGSVVTLLSRYLLVTFSNLSQVGLLGVASRVAAFVFLIFAPFLMAWQPYAMSVMHRNDAKNIYANVSRYMFFLLTVIASATILLASELTSVIGGSMYASASGMLRYVVIGIMATQFVSFFQLAILINEKPLLLLYSNAIALLVFVGVGLVITPLLGGLGMGVALMLGNTAQCATVYILAQRESPIAYPIRRTMLAVAVSIASATWLTLVQPQWLYLVLAWLLLSLVAAMFLLEEIESAIGSTQAVVFVRSILQSGRHDD